MQQDKLKRLALLGLILFINSIPVVTYAQDTKISTEITAQSKVDINDNWLTEEVAKQLNKKVRNLTEQDFLNIKKIDLRYEKIDNNIPEEINLLKNLEYLNLNYCRIDKKIPEFLGDLPKLTYLDLGDNKIEELPDNIKQKIIKGSYAYCDVEGNKFTLDEGWYYLKGKLSYLDRNGKRLEGSQTIGGKEYQFTEDGYIREGFEQNGDKSYYYDKTSGMAKDEWKQVNGKWYYFNEEGIMQKGAQTIKGVKFYLDSTGVMLTGWQTIDNKYYYFASAGGMQYGWITLNEKLYYLDASTGAMASNEEKTIDGKKYRFSSDGSVLANTWIDNYTYVQPNGETVNTYSNYSHSNTNYQLFKYMTDVNNERSVDNAAVSLHSGTTSNNCVYFTSEALRRVGVSISTSTANTYQLENVLKGIGFSSSYDFSQIKPGDIVFTNNYSHVYIFMCWDKDGYAYIVDNQGISYGNQVLHKRKILEDTATTDRATHFFYYSA